LGDILFFGIAKRPYLIALDILAREIAENLILIV
jgi:hypothetical protein